MAKSGPALFLGLELATDQLRATIVDENLDLVGVEAIDFDSELSEYQTQGGIFTTPGDAYTTPVDMWVKALDFLLEKVGRNHDASRIKAIGGSAQSALVWWKPTVAFPTLDSRLPLHNQLSPHAFALANTPVAQDTFSHTHALSLEAALGGPDQMAARVGTSASPSLVAAQLIRVREASPDVWGRTGRVQMASAFLASLLAGTWVGMNEAEACTTGLWQYTSGGQGHWDDEVIALVAGSPEEARRVRSWLGDVDVSGGGRRIAVVSKYMQERYGLEPDTIISPFTADYLSTYLSLVPSPSDAVLAFGPMDFLLTSAPHYLPTRLYNVFPHPAQDQGEKRKYIVMLTSRNADVPRTLVRDMYTKSWSAFDRLVSVVPPGGSIGLDDKLFSFWLLQGDSYPLAHVKGIYRFETGIKVNEFRDLRANPRCLVESQILSFRVRWARTAATGVLGAAAGRARGAGAYAAQRTTNAPGAASAIGLTFDPYDPSALPSRVLATGAAVNFPSVAQLAAEVLNAPVFLPATQLESAQTAPHRNAPAPGVPGRAALGGAYIARWVWGRERGIGRGSFEEEVRRLLGKRWLATGGKPPRASVLAPAAAASSGGARGFGATVFEEDEDGLDDEDTGRARTATGSSGATGVSTTPGTGASTPAQTSTAFTTPDLGGASPAQEAANGSAALVAVQALPTADTEAQLGLAKVAEPDTDAFMAYAAIVPEYCRLEGMLVKGLV
ncbi:actin-like ATPase domain-containing protein [Vararia minispora EC-137]|uniref:Actin-like ATPase domain-containing protein n=1 Tax=Vararia minispora EC-137 TaxID=1314806 RepID=A0ACB8QBS7_9AGAM|nr:actin-like ATPase domain-containing protein [Vararia minispora EC-137]